jgi:hypothetical protein
MMSRPIKYPMDQLWPAILEQIGAGSSLSAIARQPGAPSYAWMKQALRENEELRKRYQDACDDRADLLAEDIERLADEEIPEGLDGPGRSAWVQRQRLRVDARKWTASKLRPKQWGDRLITEHIEHISLSACIERGRRRAGLVIDAERGADVEEPTLDATRVTG